MKEKELKKGDLLCYIQSAYEIMRKIPTTIFIVMRDWDYYKHGDLINVWNQDVGYTTVEPDYVQKLDESERAEW
jgi:hypothetical protein